MAASATQERASTKDRRLPDPSRMKGPSSAKTARRTVWLATFAGSLLMYAAVPPLDWGWLGWIAPVPWLWLARRPEWGVRRPYLILWLGGFAFWLGCLHWLRLPHWATSFGWLALSFYLAFYVPVLVGLVRVAMFTCRTSIVIAAPIIWTGMELAKGHLLSGFTMASLEHTQYRWPQIIQIADIIGGYGVSGIIMLVAACMARMLPLDAQAFPLGKSSSQSSRRITWWPTVPAAVVVVLAAAYGQWRLDQAETTPGPRVALIQSSIDSTFKSEQTTESGLAILAELSGLTDRACIAAGDRQPDLIVWPETMFPADYIFFDPPATADDISANSEAASRQMNNDNVADWFRRHAEIRKADMLTGIAVVDYRGGHRVRYNSALFVDDQGAFDIDQRYDKVHLVMFGEYVPFAEYFPVLYNLTPLSSSLRPGEAFRSFEVANCRFAPNICYETVIPHLIRRGILELRAEGKEPQVLVNVTNDGWFWGSCQLDQHLYCGVFRAIENRKPLLIAANTGFSAWIDADGRIREQAPRQKTGFILADVQIDHRTSWYLEHGDLIPGICLTVAIGIAVIGLIANRRTLPVLRRFSSGAPVASA